MKKVIFCFFSRKNAQVGLTFYIGWDIMSPITYFFGALGVIATYSYPVISGKVFNPRKHFEMKKNEFIKSKYAEFNFDINRFDKLKDEKEALRIEIKKLKTAHNTQYKKRAENGRYERINNE